MNQTGGSFRIRIGSAMVKDLSREITNYAEIFFSGSFMVLFFPDEADRHVGMNLPAGIGFHLLFSDTALFSPWRGSHVEGIKKKLSRDLYIRSRSAIGSETGFLLTFKDVSIKKVADFAAGILQGLISFDKRRKGSFNHETGISPF